MSQVIDHLAELTGFRDRDIVDATLVTAFNDLLKPVSAAIYRPVGEETDRRWLTRARIRRGEAAPSADSMWSPLEELTPLAARPERVRCLTSPNPITVERDGGVCTLLFPLTAEREVGGVLELDVDRGLDEERVRLVTSILRVHRNFQALLDYSERDTLTGLLNRKTFDVTFMRVSSESAGEHGGGSAAPAGIERRATGPDGAWLAVIDIDHFKRVNDTHGHLIGDEVLLLLARLMRGTFRFRDLLYRFGGEEFVVLMRGGNAAQAGQAFERLRRNVVSYAFPRVGPISISIGFTAVRAGDTPNGAFERADKAVYWAKQNGRDRVAFHGELVERGILADERRTSDIELF